MKWFKHHTDSLDDPFIQALMDRFRHLGYVAYFGLIEIIAREYGKDASCKKFSFESAYLRRKLRSSETKLREVYEYCQTVGKLSVTFSEKEWEFEFPKIVEIKDNYTKDLQGAGKKVSLDKEVEVEKEEEKEKKEKKKTTRVSGVFSEGIQKELFEERWGLYPKKDGRKRAWSCFKSSVRKEEDLARFDKALHWYLKEIENREERFIMAGKTFFYNWEDYAGREATEGGDTGPEGFEYAEE